MSDGTAIAWSDATWNPVTGCSQIPGAKGAPSGCDFCYAKRLLDTRMFHNSTSPRFHKPFEVVMLHPDRLDQPLRWKRPRRIFVNSLSDLFHADVPDEYIDKVFMVMCEASQHTFQVLTKRPERMRRFVRWWLDQHGPFYLSGLRNVWFGTSISSNADVWRAEHLLKTKAAVRFLSLEPLLGPVDRVGVDLFDWVIAGGESGPGCRPCELEWLRDIRDRCKAAQVPFFLKQLGGFPRKRADEEAELDGERFTELPASRMPALAFNGGPSG